MIYLSVSSRSYLLQKYKCLINVVFLLISQLKMQCSGWTDGELNWMIRRKKLKYFEHKTGRHRMEIIFSFFKEEIYNILLTREDPLKYSISSSVDVYILIFNRLTQWVINTEISNSFSENHPHNSAKNQHTSVVCLVLPDVGREVICLHSSPATHLCYLAPWKPLGKKRQVERWRTPLSSE